jgi:hypothetical protein
LPNAEVGPGSTSAGIATFEHLAPFAVAGPPLETLPPLNVVKESLPVCVGSASDIWSSSKKVAVGPWGKVVMNVKLKCDPSEEVQPTPVEGELMPPCAEKPFHGLH